MVVIGHGLGCLAALWAKMNGDIFLSLLSISSLISRSSRKIPDWWECFQDSEKVLKEAASRRNFAKQRKS